jgi:hypothetical protein
MALVRIGFFHEFKNADTLLIDGDSEGLRLLADRLRQFVESGEAIALHETIHRGGITGNINGAVRFPVLINRLSRT